MNALADVTHTVYRLYDKDGRLIYVGCSYKPIQRIKNHRRTMWWATQIDRIDIELHPSRKSGLAAEAMIRRTELPRWNIESRWSERTSWGPEQFDDYIEALTKHPNNKTKRWLDRIENARFHRQAFFGSEQPA